MERLSPELKQYLLKFLGISDLMNMADTSMEWRNLVSDQVFLDDISRRRFGLQLSQLPELSEYEKLLINTQQMVFQAKNPKFFGCHPSLAKIYGMELRSSWFPFLFNGSGVQVDKSIDIRDLKYPWPYDQKMDGSSFYGETKKFSARIHAAFPRLFESLVGTVPQQMYSLEFRYFTGDYSDYVDLILDNDDDNEFGLIDRQPRVIKIVAARNQVLLFLIYDDNQTWRVIYRDEMGIHNIDNDQISSHIIPLNADLGDIRQLVLDVIPQFCTVLGSIDLIGDAIKKCPAIGPLKMPQTDLHLFQLDMVKVLEGVIRSSSYDLVKSLMNTEPDQRRRDLLFGKLIKLVDMLYPCAFINHNGCDESRKGPSGNLSIALSRSLRRLVNDSFLPEVKQLHQDRLTGKLIHAWSWQGKGREKDLCYATGAPTGFKFNKKCYMKEAVSFMCCHRGFVDLWPAVTLKKAIDEVPKLVKELESNVVNFVSRFNR